VSNIGGSPKPSGAGWHALVGCDSFVYRCFDCSCAFAGEHHGWTDMEVGVGLCRVGVVIRVLRHTAAHIRIQVIRIDAKCKRARYGIIGRVVVEIGKAEGLTPRNSVGLDFRADRCFYLIFEGRELCRVDAVIARKAGDDLVLIKVQVNHVLIRNAPFLLVIAGDFYRLGIVVVDQDSDFRRLNTGAWYGQRCDRRGVAVEDGYGLDCLS
jgi:hypothetical protein